MCVHDRPVLFTCFTLTLFSATPTNQPTNRFFVVPRSPPPKIIADMHLERMKRPEMDAESANTVAMMDAASKNNLERSVRCAALPQRAAGAAPLRHDTTHQP